MPNIKMNPIVSEVINAINKSGYQAYLVGGAVRDAILNKDNKDFDLCTNMPLPKVKELFPSFVIMKPNNHRNTGVMRINGEEIEISEFRGKDIIEDLSNRDFTMNAMAMDKDCNIIDPFNGIESLNKKEISLIKKDGEAFEIDPLRIMRAIRMASKMNFNLDSNCKEQILSKKELLSTVPVERIYKELIQILVTSNPAKYIRENKEIFFQIIPELKEMDGFNQNNSYHIYDVFEHTMVVLENTSNNLYLRFAALFHDIGKPSTYTQDEKGTGHFYGHPAVSSKIFELVATRLKMDNRSKKEIAKLIDFHDYTLGRKKKSVYHFFDKFGTSGLDSLFELKEADIKAQNPEYSYRLEDLQEIKNFYLDFLASNPCLSIKNLRINGNILKEHGIGNKKISKTLEEILYQVKFNDLPNTEEDIIDYVDKKYK